MINSLQEIITVAHAIGAEPSFTQGGGGNVSIKQDGAMAVKASGLRLDELDTKNGFVGIDYSKIRSFFDREYPNLDDTEFEQLSKIATQEATLAIFANNGRPSIETGFHALGDTVVLHTHSVYANLLNCSMEGGALIEKLFPEAHIIPYHTPGAPLTLAIAKALNKNQSPLFFLQNHGIITMGSNSTLAMRLHDTVNERIREHFNLKSPYPQIKLIQNGDTWESDSAYLVEFIRTNPEIIEKLDILPLFPDQMVYADQYTTNTAATSPITFDLEKGTTRYAMNERTARATEETIIAWAWLMEHIPELGLTLKHLPTEKAAHIKTMESEKYRKKLSMNA